MALSLKPIREQVIVITGASSGIGLATAEAAVRKGARVVMVARSGATLTGIAQTINSSPAGGEALAVVADVADRQQLQAAADATIQRFGRIDTWVNGAGIAIYGRLDEVTEADSRRLFDTNFWGVVNGSLVALPYLRRSGGAIINIGSEVSEAVAPLLGMYSASKHAVKGFTDALRVEVGAIDHAPVAITLIQPTAVDTPFDEHARNYMANEPNLPTPLIHPEQVAEAILEAAAKPTRYRKVGMMARFNTFMAKNLPPIADRLEAGLLNKMSRDEPAVHPEGTLFIPGECGRTHGNHAAAS